MSQEERDKEIARFNECLKTFGPDVFSLANKHEVPRSLFPAAMAQLAAFDTVFQFYNYGDNRPKEKVIEDLVGLLRLELEDAFESKALREGVA